MRVVIDTNVLVSGLLTPFGPCGAIVRLLAAGEIVPVADGRILTEYGEVLRRPRFSIDRGRAGIVLDYIRSVGVIAAPIPLADPLPDSDDEPFLEAALAAGADCLVTGNLKHYPPPLRAGARVLSPREFLEYYRRRAQGL